MRCAAGIAGLLFFIAARACIAAEIDFNRDVRPILSDRCYACHGPDAEQRQGGDEDQGGLRFDTMQGAFADLGGYVAIDPGKPESSELITRITSDDEGLVMPPPDHAKPLSKAQQQILIDWVKQGAAWKDHWAYVPPQRHPVPQIQSGKLSRNFVDNFILARLEQENVKPSPQTDKRTLLRRLSFDLIGLPPTVEEMQAFVADSSNDAYEKQVDRLLASPHFGERMAMRWLDLVRYADSVGYHGDQPVSVSPYRDYVIAAFNDNMPYDQFTREQLAGDLLPNPTRAQLIASGYNRLGMMSAEGGVQPKEYLAKYASDRVRTAAAVWLGSTLGCAECHDHKYDPFTSKDFYRFASFFADIKEKGLYSGAHASGQWGPQIDVPHERLPGLLAPIDEKIAELQKIIDTPTVELTTAQTAWEQNLSAAPQWQTLKPETAQAQHDTKLKIMEDNSILVEGSNPPQNIYTVTAKVSLKTITGFQLEVLPDKSLPQNGPGRAGNGNFVLTEFRVSKVGAVEGGATPVKLQNASATVEQASGADALPEKKWSAVLTIDGDVNGAGIGWAILPHVGKENHLVVEAVDSIENQDDTIFKFVLEFNYPGGQHAIGKFRLAATSTPLPLKAKQQDEIPANIREILVIKAAERNEKQSQALAAYYRSIAPALAETRQQIADLNKRRAETVKSNTRTSLITVSVDPRTMRVLSRGNWMDETGEEVQPGVPHFLRQIRNDDRANRLDLANWLTAPDNPLTSRVFVNRLWQLYFGTGLSKVLDDVGGQGEPPSHAELLDTLAVDFIESGWDVKQMIKLLVTSATYRQSSMPRDDLRTTDPYNRLLARQSRFRFDAEIIRDNALAVSGLLVKKIGGRSVKPYQPAGLYRHLNFPARTYQQDSDENQFRRGVYTHWQRQFLHPAMKAFDAPSREECTAQRPRSNTPLGALVLLNDPSYVEAARVFAEQAIQQGGTDATHRIDWLMQHALSREPIQDEQQVLQDLLTSHIEYYREHPHEANKLNTTGLTPVPATIDPIELAAWTAITRTIFNLHEFITRN